MAYNELIKNFEKIREYMREFYIYGFKSREEYDKKSARSYDDERRRIESWLGDYMDFRQTAEGKNVFMSIDSRTAEHNPLFKAFKAKSFTDGDITLHFLLFDILQGTEKSTSDGKTSAPALTLNEIMDELDSYLSSFETPKEFEISTVRKKLNEYVREGLIIAEKCGKTMTYRRAENLPLPPKEMMDFYSEAFPLGAVGSFILDKYENEGYETTEMCESEAGPHEGDGKQHEAKQSNANQRDLKKHNVSTNLFRFKHNFITGALDSEVMCSLFMAIHEKRAVDLRITGKKKEREGLNLIPLKIYISAQNGREYVMMYTPQHRRINAYRLDKIRSVSLKDEVPGYDDYQEMLERMKSHLWGVSTQGHSRNHLEKVSFTVKFDSNESHIPERLEREKRCGYVELLDKHHARFTAEVFDTSEMIPWIRTFICRITELDFSDKVLEKQFRNDIKAMYEMYGLTEEVEV